MSGIKFVLDTNAVYFLFQGKLKETKIISDLKTISISIITELEYLSNKELTAKDKSLFEDLKAEIIVKYITDKDVNLLNRIILIRKKYKLKLPDAIIAATTMENNATLISSDAAFSKIFNLKFILIKP